MATKKSPSSSYFCPAQGSRFCGNDGEKGESQAGARGVSASKKLHSRKRENGEKQAGEGKKASGEMTPTQRRRFFERLAEADPHPSTELDYKTPFELLVAVLLSAQATDKSVNKATPPLFKAANTPEKVLALGEEGLVPYIQTIGLFRSKARHIIGLCEQLLREHRGKVPSSREALERLPGVGRKTANVVLNVAFGEPTIAVDTHIFRVANRTGLAAGKNVLEVEQALLKNVPKAFLQHAHHWLVLHGRYVCMARRPRCPECVVGGLCLYLGKTVL